MDIASIQQSRHKYEQFLSDFLQFMSVGISPNSEELSTHRLGSDSLIAQSRELIEEHNDLVQSI